MTERLRLVGVVTSAVGEGFWVACRLGCWRRLLLCYPSRKRGVRCAVGDRVHVTIHRFKPDRPGLIVAHVTE